MNNLQTYLSHNKKYITNDWRKLPIIHRWMALPRMQKTIQMIDKKVGYLLNKSPKKIEEWFGSDASLTQITAERYILDHLRGKNLGRYSENFAGSGVDAYLRDHNNNIGIEVTSINKTIAAWVLNERLLIYLENNKHTERSNIRIKYRIQDIEKIKYSLDLVEKIGQVIISGKQNIDLNGLEVIREVPFSSGGLIIWDEASEEYDLVELLKQKLTAIISDKSKQLKKNTANILFICVNQLPLSSQNPTFFEEITSPIRYASEAQELQSFIQNILPDYINGVCFFVYTLESEDPMYKLKILWKNKPKQISLEL